MTSSDDIGFVISPQYPSFPVCGVALYIHIHLFFSTAQHSYVNTMQLPITTMGQNYREQTIAVLNKINPVSSCRK